MILGILSDSHGHRRRTRRALEILERCGATAFVHCGDFCEPDVCDELVGRRVWFVWGNNDEPIREYERYAASIGLAAPPRELPVRFSLEGKRFAVCHGHEHWFADAWSRARYGDTGPSLTAPRSGGAGALADALDADYVLYGHSHIPANELLSGVRFINPGALHRARVFSVATLNLADGVVRYWNTPRGDEPAAAGPPEELHIA